jgi:hypothetical protein
MKLRVDKTPVFKWIWERCPAKNGDKLVLLRLACFSEADGTCWAAPEMLEASTGMTRRNIYRCMDRLVANGWLVILGEKRVENGRMLCRRYRIAFENDNLSVDSSDNLSFSSDNLSVGSDNLSFSSDNLSVGSDNLSFSSDNLSTDNKEKEHNEVKKLSADAPASATVSPSLPSSEKKAPKPKKAPAPKFDPASIPLPHGAGLARAWAEFAQHRRELRAPLTPTAAKRIIDDLAAVNEAAAVEALRKSVKHGWRGCFVEAPAKPVIVELPPQGRPKQTALERSLAEMREQFEKENAA